MIRPALERLESRELPAAPYQLLPAYPFGDTAAYDHVRAIAAEARMIGRNANAVLKIGDSNSEGFAEDAYLKPLSSANPAAIAAFGPSILDTWLAFRSSFGTVSPAAQMGYTTLSVQQ